MTPAPSLDKLLNNTHYPMTGTGIDFSVDSKGREWMYVCVTAVDKKGVIHLLKSYRRRTDVWKKKTQ